jgi:hypothetical protein
VALAACAGAPTSADTGPRACNGSIDLCDRPFDQVALAFAHNAMSNADDGWLAPNQHHGLQRQLDDGVRGFMLDTHTWDDAHPGVYLCHGSCVFGAIPAEEAFGILASFLASHPGEVIALVIEAGVSPEETEAALAASGLLDFAHAQPLGDPWPTLGALVERDTRVVIFTESDGGAFPWYHDAYAYAWDTDYAAETLDDFSCDVLRGDRANALFLLNHFLTAPLASESLAAEANPESVLRPRIDRCEAETGDFVNWIAVDFYDVGDALTVVAAQNGISR